MGTLLILVASLVLAQPVIAQEMPPEYSAVLKTLARQGDYKDGVLKVNIPRNDLHVSVAGVLQGAEDPRTPGRLQGRCTQGQYPEK